MASDNLYNLAVSIALAVQLVFSIDLSAQNNFSLEFDGIDDYVSSSQADLDVSSTNQLTILSWIKLQSYPNDNQGMRIFRHGGNSPIGQQYALAISNSNLYFYAENGGFEQNGNNISNSVVNLNEWTHVGVTYDGISVKLFQNGELVFEKEENDIFTDSDIGNFEFSSAEASTPNALFEGNIDETSIWNKSLTQEDIQFYMNCDPNGDEEGLLGFWNFEEGAGSTLNDLSNNTNTGNLSGASWSTDTQVKSCQACLVSNPSSLDYIEIDIEISQNIIDLGQEIELISLINGNSIPPFSSGLNEPLQEGLVGFWPFNGNADDESEINSNNGQIIGAQLDEDRFGQQNSSFLFDGQDDVIEMSTSNGLPYANSERTISLWLKLSDLPGTFTSTAFAYGSASNSNAFMLGLTYNQEGQRVLAVQGWFDDITEHYEYNVDEWFNFIATYNGENVSIYGNGDLIGTNLNETWITLQDQFLFGGRVSQGNSFYAGNIDDIAIWNRVFSPEEITQLYIADQVSYQWSTGESAQSITVSPIETTTYELILSYGESCEVTTEITVYVNSESIQGEIPLEGTCGERELNYIIIPLENDFDNISGTTILNSDGTFSLESIPEGVYDIFIKPEGFLQKKFTSIEVSGGENALEFDGFLPGDLNGDNSINIADFSPFSATYGSVEGTPEYNYLADFNCDGLIGIVDFSSFSASFGLNGDDPINE